MYWGKNNIDSQNEKFFSPTYTIFTIEDVIFLGLLHTLILTSNNFLKLK